MLKGIERFCVTVPSVNTTVGLYIPCGALNPVLIVSKTVTRLPGPKPIGVGLNWQAAVAGSP